jgi:hypothetical protein
MRTVSAREMIAARHLLTVAGAAHLSLADAAEGFVFPV